MRRYYDGMGTDVTSEVKTLEENNDCLRQATKTLTVKNVKLMDKVKSLEKELKELKAHA